MMLRRRLNRVVCWIWVLLCSAVMGQNTIDFSERFSVQRRTSVTSIGAHENQFYLHFSSPKKGQLAVFDNLLNHVETQEFNLPEDPYTIRTFHQVKDSIYSIGMYHDNGQKYFLGSMRYDSLFHKTKRELLAFESPIAKWRMQIRMEKAFNQDWAMYYVDNRSTSENYSLHYAIHRIGSDSIYSQKVDLGMPMQNNKVSDCLIDNDGNVFILFKIKEPKVSVSTPGRYTYQLFKIESEKATFRKVILQDDSTFFGDFRLKIDELNKRVVVAGFISKSTYSEVHGFRYQSFDKANLQEIKTENTILTMYELRKLGVNNVRNQERGLDDLKLRDLVLRSDGGVVFVAEEEYTSVVNYSNSNLYMTSYSTSQVYYYHSNNVIAASFDGNGKMDWSAYVPKKQESQDKRNPYMGIGYAYGPKGLQIVYNESVSRSEHLSAVDMDTDGNKFNSYISNDRLLIHSLKQVSGFDWIGVLEDYGDFRVVKVRMEDATAD